MARVLLLAVATLSLAARAQAPAADLEQVWLDGAGRGSITVGNGSVLEATRFRTGAALTYHYNQFHSATSATGTITDRLGVQVFGAVGVTRWLELSAQVPVIFSQAGDPALGAAGAGLGNPFLHAKVAVLDDGHPVAMSFGLGLGLPLGTAVAQGNGGLEVLPRLTVGKVHSDWQYGLELSALVRRTVDFSGVTGDAADRVGSQLAVAGMVGTVNSSGPRAEVTARAFVSLAGAPAGLEVLIGGRWLFKDIELFAAVGPGLGGAPATPTFRGFLGAAFGDVGLTRPPCVEGQSYQLADCPALDQDGDGVKNALDKAPTEAEDKDGFEDEDGAPDPDNDRDGVLDPDDGCPNQAGPKDNRGCPDADADQDGVVDRLDKCPSEPEDKDGFEDADGCPELDNDGDAVPDEKDACPAEKGILEERGCPAKDGDGDAVMDWQDNCPVEKGEPGNSGCPAAQKQLLVITHGAIVLTEGLRFDSGKATLQPKVAALDQLATVLAAHPEVGHLTLEGHFDHPGDTEAARTKLAQERVDAVKAYLVKKGVAESRLATAAVGDQQSVKGGENFSLKLVTAP